MLSLLSPSTPARSDPPTFAGADVTSLLGISDPWHRLQLAADMVKELEAQLQAMRAIRRDAVAELVHQRRTPLSRVAAFVGLTKTRIGQLAHDALRATGSGDAR